MTVVIHIKKKTWQPWDAETSKGGYWWHAWCNWRIDCPDCGEKEGLAYWISPADIADDGSVKGEKHCQCGFGGKLVLDDFPTDRWDLRYYQELLRGASKI